ncbi:FliG C-terminal domain-containing protein [Magnetospira sp. QH-2]|uniref:FliG C-terminal domain-containing protein n=1 Tax=Magnetospira sp. (strain QH-2) TaxID=1288970 RepID=UPI0003E81B16
MKISAKALGKNQYLLAFDDARVTLDQSDLKQLLAQLNKLVSGGAVTPDKVQAHLIALIKAADNLGLQALLHASEPDDILMLLKAGEADKTLKDRLFANMSERARRVVEEDLAFKYKDGVPHAHLSVALARLSRTITALRGEGRLSIQSKKQTGST